MFRGSKWKMGLVLTGTAMVAGTPGCELVQPEGVLMKAPADGIVTEYEAQETIELMEREIVITEEVTPGFEVESIIPEGVIKFEGPAQNFVNDQDVFFAEEFERQGLESFLFDDDVYVYLTDGDEEHKEKFSRCHAGFKDKPDETDAFFCVTNNTIYIPKGRHFPNFSRIAQHEAGHRKSYGVDEMRSVAWEVYTMLKTIGLNRKIGSYILGEVEKHLRMPRVNDQLLTESNLQKYHIGYLGFFIFANKYGGNLEKAMHHLMTAPKLNLENEVRNAVQKYSNLRGGLQQEFEKLSTQIGLRESYGKLDNKEFEELSKYLKVLTHIMISNSDYLDYRNSQIQIDILTSKINNLNDPIFNSQDAILNSQYKLEIEELEKKKDEFMKHYESSKPILRMLGEEYLATAITNPYLRAKVVVPLSFTYSRDKALILLKEFEDFNLEDKKEVFDLSKKIIEINQGLPCDYEFYECPKFVSVPRWDHADSFFDALRYSEDLLKANLVSRGELINIGMNFVESFYTNGKLGFEENVDKRGFQTAVSILGPFVTYTTGILLKDKMIESIGHGNEDIYRSNCNMARLMFEYAQAGSCQLIEDQEKQDICMGLVRGDYLNGSQVMIDSLGDCEMPDPD